LYAFIKSRLVNGKMTYIFIDEVQKVPEFEKENTDIYLTGSNSYLLFYTTKLT